MDINYHAPSYRYQVFNQDYHWLGEWKNVINNPQFRYRLNEYASEMSIDIDFYYGLIPYLCQLDFNVEVELNYSKFASVESDVLQTERLAETLLTEDGQDLELERGVKKYTPTTKTIFKGYIKSYQISMDGSRVRITLLNHGQRMNRLMLTLEGDSPFTSQGTDPNTNSTVRQIASGGSQFKTAWQQKFTIPSGSAFRMSDARIFPRISSSATRPVNATFKVRIYDRDIFGNAGTKSDFTPPYESNTGLLGEATTIATIPPLNRSSSIDATAIDFDFNPALNLTPNNTYYFVVWVEAPRDRIWNGVSSNKVYDSAGFKIWHDARNINTTNVYIVSDTNIFVRLIGSTTNYENPLNQPASKTLQFLIDFAKRHSILVESDIAATTKAVAYVFKNSFILDAIKTIILADGQNYISYIDFGNNQFIYKPQSEARNYFVKQKHIREVGHLTLTNEEEVNEIYFVGGKESDSENNVFTFTQRQKPYRFKKGLFLTDNRVASDELAKRISQGFLDFYSEPLVSGQMSINRNPDFDIEDIRPGDRLFVSGINQIIDNFDTRIINVVVAPDHVIVSFGYVQPNLNDNLDIVELQTRKILDENTGGSAN